MTDTSPSSGPRRGECDDSQYPNQSAGWFQIEIRTSKKIKEDAKSDQDMVVRRTL